MTINTGVSPIFEDQTDFQERFNDTFALQNNWRSTAVAHAPRVRTLELRIPNSQDIYFVRYLNAPPSCDYPDRHASICEITRRSGARESNSAPLLYDIVNRVRQAILSIQQKQETETKVALQADEMQYYKFLISTALQSRLDSYGYQVTEEGETLNIRKTR